MSSRAMKSRYGVKKKNTSAAILMVIVIALGVIVAVFTGLSTLVATWLQDLPEYDELDDFNTSKPTVIYAADHTTVLAQFQLEERKPVAFNQISSYVIQGTVATEDVRFYEHDGVDIIGVGRALLNNLTGGRLEGASTITQQFVRNTVLNAEMNDISFKRKIREMYISLKVEEQYDKNEILLMYLNTINYGSGAYGIEAAAQRYYSKNAIDLTLNEAATLVGIPQSPTFNNPIDNPENCLARRNTVLDRMVSSGVITKEEAELTKAEPITLNETVPSVTGILNNPYFTSYVRNQLTDPNGRYAYSASDIFKGGLTVYTTIDTTIQKKAEQAAAAKVNNLGGNYEVSLVAIDPDNGYIKAMVGGTDYDASQVNMATGEGSSGRQAGSSFKTFTLIAALEAGINPDTLIDASTYVEFPGWKVANISNINYGTRSIAQAFAVSSNTAFARLCMAVGPSKVAEVAHRMGIDSDLPETGSVTLGTGSVNPLEMAEAYATIASGGIHYEPECITQILNSEGQVIVDNSVPMGERVLEPEIAHAAIEVMEGVVTSGSGTGAALKSGQVVAGKTGTSDDYYDVWFCGITPQLSVAIWLGDRAGYSKGKPLPDGTKCVDVYADFMNSVLTGRSNENFFTADEPEYQSGYVNSKYHIGGYYSSGGGNVYQGSGDGLDQKTTEGSSTGSSSSGSSSNRNPSFSTTGDDESSGSGTGSSSGSGTDSGSGTNSSGGTSSGIGGGLNIPSITTDGTNGSGTTSGGSSRPSMSSGGSE